MICWYSCLGQCCFITCECFLLCKLLTQKVCHRNVSGIELGALGWRRPITQEILLRIISGQFIPFSDSHYWNVFSRQGWLTKVSAIIAPRVAPSPQPKLSHTENLSPILSLCHQRPLLLLLRFLIFPLRRALEQRNIFWGFCIERNPHRSRWVSCSVSRVSLLVLN